MARSLTDTPHHLERDACGIGFVASIGGEPSRAVLDRVLEALTRVRHRGAVAADHRTGDGAGVLLPLPEALAPSWPRAGDGLRTRRRRPRGGGGGVCRRGYPGPLVALGARRPRRAWARGPRQRAADRPGGARGAPGHGPGAPRLPRPPPPRRPRRRLRRLAVVPDGRLQGALRGRPAGRLLSRSRRSGARGAVRRLPPALLDEHRAVVGARAAVPDALPQRRDQRHPRQRQLDARPHRRARPRPFAEGPLLDETSSDSGMLDNALELLVRGGRDVEHALAMLDPARVAGRPGAAGRRPLVPPLPRGAGRAVGRPRGRSSSATAASSAPGSTATGCGRCATRSPATSSAADPRQVSSICQTGRCSGAASARASCSSSTPTAGCCTTAS